MKVSLSWLKEHLETDASVETIIQTLNAIGLVVDDVKRPGAGLEAFVIAEILTTQPHPEADRLRVCQVYTGQETLQVVCGAPNARPGLKGVFAAAGVTIPANGMVLKPVKIRNVESCGMMCSYQELGLEGGPEGTIIELPSDAPVGERYVSYAGLDDPILDIGITPNRGDCFAVRGIARDLAAARLGTLKPQDVRVPIPTFSGSITVKRMLPKGAEEACPYFVGREIRHLKNVPSPQWLQRKLQAAGIRSISAVVDVTNLMALEWARPMHAFDAERIQGHLTVRLARHGEKLQALDGNEYILDEQMVVIADDRTVLSLGGIMGGMESGCRETTTHIFLESALFDRRRIAVTGQRLGIHSDSRTRFERGVDPALVVWGLERATQLILEICGGEAGEIVSTGHAPESRNQVVFDPSLLQRHGGLAVPLEEIESILAGLGCVTTRLDKGKQLRVCAPSWRHDIDNPYDIVEEVLRIKGYDAIPAVPLTHSVLNEGFESMPGSRIRQRREWIARRTLAARGLCEGLTWSFTRQEFAQLFGGGQEELQIDNPISQELSVMRPSLLPNLLVACGRSLARGQAAPAFFEVGNQFADATITGQKTMATGIRSGRNYPRHWQGEEGKPSVYTVKADVLEVLAACDMDIGAVQISAVAPAWYHPGRSGTIRLGPKNTLAFFGELHPKVLKALEIVGPLYAFEIYLSDLPVPKGMGKKTPLILSPYQPIERDLAFIVDQSVPAAKVLQVIQKTDKTLIQAVSIFDVYVGPNVGAGKKSLAFSIRLEPRERTLTEEDITRLIMKIIANVHQETGGELRS
jgi:phenylalanyl-tRNA synthetase beta chain